MNAQELKDFLKRNKMTGNELALKLNVHWTTISRWRNGHEPIPKTVELALKWIEAEGQIEAIGQNGNHAMQKSQTAEEWYNSLSEVEKIDAVNCVHDMRGKWNGMIVVFYRGLKINKRKFDWIKRNITGSKL